MKRDDIIESLHEKLKVLSETIWDRQHSLAHIYSWLDQFSESENVLDDEKIHALYLLTNFTYFGQAEIRALLVSLYRDQFRAPLIRAIRKNNNDTTDLVKITQEYERTLARTRFLGVGNPSESGSHLLYYFRQENGLPKTAFINSHEIFSRTASGGAAALSIRDNEIEHYVFIDDLCGSGTQAEQYSEDLVNPIKQMNANAQVHYLVLFGTVDGLKKIRALNRYDTVESVFELDYSFKCLEEGSRIFPASDDRFNREKILLTCQKFGSQLWPTHPLGYKNGQLLMGFSHNTPDNTLPIFWAEGAGPVNWKPMFKRYNKIYG